MLDTLLFTFLERRSFNASFSVKKTLEVALDTGSRSWAYRVEIYGVFGQLQSAATSPDRDSAIRLALGDLGFAPVEADCVCDPVVYPDMADGCPYHAWQRQQRLSEQE